MLVGAAMIVAVPIALAAGLVLGLSWGDFNARIDFCDDDTSNRYIQDPAARAASCE